MAAESTLAISRIGLSVCWCVCVAAVALMGAPPRVSATEFVFRVPEVLAHPQEIADSHIHQGARSVKTTNTTSLGRPLSCNDRSDICSDYPGRQVACDRCRRRVPRAPTPMNLYWR
ncbi:hypothetical protein EVAR_6185_1 [Eumeta japonica]|uniref:Uncharacterized protein n=1 Tax=Eumeta variegata TaxID=151549 RepID=A0A4C1TF93_EUMVA|nr:hypothetical protein EVAR_6185_1 [Eumeta japonica]